MESKQSNEIKKDSENDEEGIESYLNSLSQRLRLMGKI